MELSEWIFTPDDIEISNIVIGRGAFGEVRIAKWRNIHIACKSLHNQHENLDNNIYSIKNNDQWKQEINMLAKLRHPNLVLFIGICEGFANYETMILTELLSYSLYDLLELKKTILELPDILDIGIDISSGLDYLHRHNPSIVHRDISCKNILIIGNKAKIADLGQAKLFGDLVLSKQTGMPGAMAYAAPEVLTGKYSSKIDIFSYGILFIQMCTSIYPRIDQREEQIEIACQKYPLFANLINNTVNYQPNERPTAEYISQELVMIMQNDRYYPISRRNIPEKEISILGKKWMIDEIHKQCEEVNIELIRTKSLLKSEEERWKHEAIRSDEIEKQLNDNINNYQIINEKYNQLQLEYHNLQDDLIQSKNDYENIKNQLSIISTELTRNNLMISNYELQLASQYKELNDTYIILNNQRNDNIIINNQLDYLKSNENKLKQQIEQLNVQLNMQLEYTRDLELRLEQTLTRWKLEKDLLKNEKNNFSKLNNQCASLVAINKHLTNEISRCEEKLRLYEDLPLPDEIKMKFKDLQLDTIQARDEITQLLNQKSILIEEKTNLMQTIDDNHIHINDLKLQLENKDKVIHDSDMNIIQLNNKISDMILLSTNQHEKHLDIETKYSLLIEKEKQLNEKLIRYEIDLKNEKHTNSILQKTISLKNTQKQQSINNIMNDNIIDDVNNNVDQTKELLNTLEDNNLITNNNIITINDNNNNNEIDDETILKKSDVGVKHLVDFTSEKKGIAGVIQLMQQYTNDERIIWRGSRVLREYVLKDELNKNILYESNIEQWLLLSIEKFNQSAVVQGHCMRLIGVLAFGNDRFRRKAGEKGMMTSIIDAFKNHLDDETVQLHVSTALTNLTHNSMENRSRFIEQGGIDLVITMMNTYKDVAKLQRQGCWSILTLCGTDEISREIALKGGDTAVLNAMLTHSLDAGVQQFGCWALSNLALSGEDISRRIKKKGAIEICKISIETHPMNAEVVRQAKNALGIFGSSHPNNNNNNTNTIGTNQILPTSNTSPNNHHNDSNHHNSTIRNNTKVLHNKQKHMITSSSLNGL